MRALVGLLVACVTLWTYPLTVPTPEQPGAAVEEVLLLQACEERGRKVLKAIRQTRFVTIKNEWGNTIIKEQVELLLPWSHDAPESPAPPK